MGLLTDYEMERDPILDEPLIGEPDPGEQETGLSPLAVEGDGLKKLREAMHGIQEEEDAARVEHNLETSLEGNPQQVIKNQQMAGELEVPAERVEADPKFAENQIKINQANKALGQAPFLKELLKDRTLAEVMAVPEDIENLSWYETIWKDMENMFDEGRLTHEQGMRIYNKDNLNETQKLESIKRIEEIDKILEGYHADKDGVFGPSGPLGEAALLVGQVFEGLDEIAKKASAGALGGATTALIAGQAGPQAGLPEELITVPAAGTLMGSIAAMGEVFNQARMVEAGHAEKEMIGMGFEPRLAKNTSHVVGWVNGSLEVIGIGLFTKPIKSAIVKAIAKKAKLGGTVSKKQALVLAIATIFKSAGGEAGTEVLQEINNFLSREVARHISSKDIDSELDTPRKLKEAATQIGTIGIKVFAGSAVLGSPGGMARYYAERRKVSQADINEKMMTALGENAQESNLAEQLPDKHREYVEAVTEEGPVSDVYVDSAAVQEFYQDDAAAVMEELGLTDQYETALETDSPIRIPLPDYASNIARNPEAHAALIPHAKFDADGFTPTEARQQVEDAERLDDDGETILRKHMEGQKENDTFDNILNDQRDQLIKGGISEENATKMATLYATNQRAMAEAMKMPLEEYNNIISLKADSIKKPLVMTVEEHQAMGDPTVEELREKGYDGFRVIDGDKTVRNQSLKGLERNRDQQQTQTLDQATAAVKAEPGFKEFIKDSKVVDEAGEPMVVYHGTDKDFTEFDTSDFGTWFAVKPDLAGDYAQDKNEDTSAGGRVLPVYLSIKNPLKIPREVDLDFENEVDMMLANINAANGTSFTPEQIGYTKDSMHSHPGWEALAMNDRFLKAAMDAGFDGVSAYQGQELTFNAFHPEQIKSIFAKKFDPASPNILEQMSEDEIFASLPTPEEIFGVDKTEELYQSEPGKKKAKKPKPPTVSEQTGSMDTIYPEVNEALKEGVGRMNRAERTMFKKNIKAHAGTLWAAAAVRGVTIREIFFRSMEGRNVDELLNSKLWGKDKLGRYSIIKDFLTGDPKQVEKRVKGYTFIGDNRKAELDISGSFKNCNPSKNCAKFCYAADANARPTELIKAEFTEWAAENHKDVLADRLFEMFEATDQHEDGLALRINDKGDLSEAQLVLIQEMNRRGVRMQIFSKRPDLLRKVSDFNLKMLSIDETNFDLAMENPDLQLAVVIGKGMTESQIAEINDRVAVYLPINQGKNSVSRAEVKERFPTVFNEMTQKLCPVDGGKLKTKRDTHYVDIIALKPGTKGLWTCGACDMLGAAGCFFGKNKSENVRKIISQIRQANGSEEQTRKGVDEFLKRAEKDLKKAKQRGEINEDEYAGLIRALYEGKRNIRTDLGPDTKGEIDREANGPVTGDAEERGGSRPGTSGLGSQAAEIPWNEKGEITKLFIRGPWDEKIISGGKTLEVRGRAIPAKHIGVPIVLKNENNEALGEVVFKGSRQVKTAKEFNKLRKQHQVEKGSEFDFGSRKETHVWEIESVKPYTQPQKLAPMKGQAPFQVEKKIEGPQELYQDEVAEEVNPTWHYSTLADAVHNLKPSKAQPKSAEEWLNIIRKLPKVKAGEIAATGLENYLALDHRKYLITEAENKVKSAQENLEMPSTALTLAFRQNKLDEAQAELDKVRKMKQPKFTHDQIKQYLNDNGVKLVDVTNGIPQDGSEFAWYTEKLEEIDRLVDERSKEIIAERMDDLRYDLQYDRAEANRKKLKAGADPIELYAETDPSDGTRIYADYNTGARVAMLMEDEQNFAVIDLVDEEYSFVEKEILAYETHVPLFGEELTNPIWIKIREMKRKAREQAEAEFLDNRNQIKDNSEGVTKFTNWMHEGGKDYVEWLITLPGNKMAALTVPAEALALREKIVKWAEMKAKDAPGGGNQSQRVAAWLSDFKVNAGTANFLALKSNSDIFTKEEMHYYYRHAERYFYVAEIPSLKETHGTRFFNPPAKEFKHDSHFPNPNILVHVRADERVGERIILDKEKKAELDAAQAEWKKADDALTVIRKKMYGATPEIMRTLYAPETEALEVVHKKSAVVQGKLKDLEGSDAKAARVLYIQELQSDWADARRESDAPPAPFVDETKDYTALALKRMIHHAISNGFDRIEWTSGIQQDTRYEMERFISGIIWNPDTKVLRARPRGEKEFVEIADHVEEVDLPKYIGGDAAARLIRSEPPSPRVIAKFEKAKFDRKEAQEKYRAADLSIPPLFERFERKIGYPEANRIPESQRNRIKSLGASRGEKAETYFENFMSFLDGYPEVSREEVFALAKSVDKLEAEKKEAMLMETRAVKKISQLERKTGSVIEDLEANDKALSGIEVQVATDGMKDYYDKILPSVAKDVLKKLGVKNAKIDPAGDLTPEEYTRGFQPGFDLDQVREALTDEEGKTKRIALFQEKQGLKRGALQFGPDISKGDNVILLLENADLSTYLHELGHFFYEQLRYLANQPNAPQKIKDDMDKLLKFVGGEKLDLAAWNNMTLEERRTGHEKVARAFEAYLFEGNAPTLELQGIFRSFAAWMKQIYTTIRSGLKVNLSDEVREVFDRMLATDEEIANAREINRMKPLFENNEVIKMDPDRWLEYQRAVTNDVEEADEKLRTKSLDNMKWLRIGTNRILLEKKREVRDQREAVKNEAEQTVAEKQEYKLVAWLRQPVDKKKTTKSHKTDVTPEVDSLFVAIGKLGGIKQDELYTQWGVDKKTEYGTFRKVARTKDGLSIDDMGTQLVQYGYLHPLGQDGKYEPHVFEALFVDEISGRKHNSVKNDQYEASEAYEDNYFKFAQEEGQQGKLEDAPHQKISIQSLIDTFGNEEEAIWKTLPKGRWGLISDSEDAINVNLLKDLAGYSSADEMIHALVKAKPMRDAIEEETDRRMLELFGTLGDRASIDKAVDEALHNEARTKAVHAELSALAKRVGKGNVLMKAARAWAEEKIGRMKIMDIKPSQFAAAEARANRLAENALKRGNLDEATDHKRAAVLNHHFAKVASKALEEVDRNVRFFNRLDSKGARKAIDPEYMIEIDRLLGKFDIRKSVTQKALKRRETLSQWVQAELAKGNNPNIDPRLLGEIELTHYRQVPMDEFRGLYDTIKNIDHLGRLKNELLLEQEKRDVQAAVNEITLTINATAKKKKIKDSDKRLGLNNPQDQWKKDKLSFMAEHRKFGNIGRVFDGLKNGPFWQFVTKKMNAQADWQAEMQEKANIKLGELFSVYNTLEFTTLKGGLYKLEYVPDIDISLSKQERIMIALNWGNETNRARVTDGYGLSASEVENHILSTLDERDWTFVQGMWDYIEEYWALIEAKERRVTGVAPEKVEALPVNTGTAVGQIRGGYFPITFDQDESNIAFDNLAKTAADQAKLGAAGRATTARGHTKARAEGEVNIKIKADFGVIFSHVHQVIHDLAWHEWLIDTNKILGHQDMVDAITAHYGAATYKALKNTVIDIAAGDVPSVQTHEKAMNWLRQGMSIAAMGWNLGTSLLQPLGLTQSMVRVGPIYVAKAMLRFFSGAAAMDGTVKFMYEHSSFMRLRGKTMNREINEIRNKIAGTGFVSKVRGPIDDTFFYLIAKAQLMADIPTWLGAYEKAQAENASEQDSIAMADQAVIDSQGSGHIKDLASIQRGGPLKKLWTNFMSYFQTTYNLSTDSIKGTNFKSPTSIARLGVDFLLLYTFPILIEEYVRGALLRGECDDGKDWACMRDKIVRDHIAYPLSGIFIGREFVGMAQGFSQYQGPAGMRGIAEAGKFATQVGQMENDEKLWKAANKTGGVFFHWPAVQVERLIWGSLDLAEGKTDKVTAPLFGYSKQ